MKKLFLYTAAMFLMLAPGAVGEDALEALSYMEGKWSVTSSFYEDHKWTKPAAPMRATADSVLGGAFIRLDAPVSFPGATFQFEMTLSYDRFHGDYRMMVLDDLNGYMDIYVGNVENKTLSLSNAETGTSFPDGNGGVVIAKVGLEKSAEGFMFTGFVASKPDGPYTPYMRLEFQKAE